MGFAKIAATLCVIALTLQSNAGAQSGTAAKVVAVVDGDTISVERGKGKERVILYGIDCPEIDQPAGADAKKYTDDRCWRKTIILEDHGTDSRGRTIAVVWLPDGTNLNQELVRKGLAWWSDKYAPKDAKLKQLHDAAKTARIGLWSAPNPVPPWTWRNGQKNVQATVLPSK